MKIFKFLIPGALIFLLPSAQARSLCGRYENVDPTNRKIVAIVDYKDYPMQGLVYYINNPQTEAVHNLVFGYCYCVTGAVAPDPLNQGDSLFARVTIDAVKSGPYFTPDCVSQ